WRARSSINKEIKRVRGIVEGVGSALDSIAQSPTVISRKVSRDAVALMKHRSRRYFRVKAGPGLDVQVSADVEDAGKTPYRILLQGNPQDELTGTVEVSRDLLDTRAKTYRIGGVDFALQAVEATEAEPACAIDLKNHFVVLNLNHPLVESGDRSVIEILVYLAYGLETADSPKDLADKLVELMVAARRK